DTEFVRRTRHFRDRGTTGKLHLALDRLPESIKSLPQGGKARMLIALELDRLERAFDACKYRGVADAVPMEIVVPTLADSSLAPVGQHVLSANVHYLPYALAEGDWNAMLDTVKDRLVADIDSHLPGIKAHIVG